MKKSLHVKGLHETFLSVGQICDQDKLIVFTRHEAVTLKITKFSASNEENVAVILRIKHGGSYESSAEEIMQCDTLTAKPSNDINLWHMRLIHVNLKVLKSLQQSSVDFTTLKRNLQRCHSCLMGKRKRKPFVSNFKPVDCPGEVVHSDLSGKLP